MAFGGRVIGPGEPKYLNSPETDLFHKGRELYGLYEHRREVQQSGAVLVVEGYMDVVMLAQHGVDNAVATLGTAVTSDQIRRLFKLADDVVFAFDGDAAGRKAAWRALENTLPQLVDGKRPAFLFLPEGEDPDSYVRAQGAEAFRAQAKRALPLSDFLVHELTTRTELESQEGRVRLATLAGPYLKQLVQAPLLAGALGRRLTELTGVPLARPAYRERIPGRRAMTEAKGMGLTPWRVLTQAVLQKPERAAMLGELPQLSHPEGELLQTLLAILRAHPHVTNPRDVGDLFEGRPEQTAILEAVAVVNMFWDGDYDMEADLQGALASLREQAGKQESKLLSRKPLAELSPEERERLRQSVKAKKLPQVDTVKLRKER
jgi:DNA primase